MVHIIALVVVSAGWVSFYEMNGGIVANLVLFGMI